MQSMHPKVKKGLGLANKSIFEIRTIIDDMRIKTVGGITTALLLWESCTLQVLLHNSSTWLDMKKKDVEKLVKLQNLFLNTTLGVQNCPALFMLWELGILSIPLRLLKEKLLLYHHVSTLSEESLARRILETQERLHFPSLRDEVVDFLAKYEVYDMKKFSKEKLESFCQRKNS